MSNEENELRKGPILSWKRTSTDVSLKKLKKPGEAPTGSQVLTSYAHVSENVTRSFLIATHYDLKLHFSQSSVCRFSQSHVRRAATVQTFNDSIHFL